MTKKEQHEFDGFIKAKRLISKGINNRIEVLEERRGDQQAIAIREALISELECVREYIRNVILYKVESKTRSTK